MAIYILSFIISIFSGKIILGDTWNSPSKNKIIYLCIIAIYWGLLCAFRSTSMAYDTIQYQVIFEHIPSDYTKVTSQFNYLDPGFVFFCSFIKKIGGDFITLQVIYGLFIMGGVCYFIYKHSDNVLLSTFIIFCFPFYYTSFDIMRYYIAITFFYIAYNFFVQRKPIAYITTLLLGCLFHKSCFFLIPFYFINKLKWNKKFIVLSIIITIIIYFSFTILAINILGENSKYVGSEWIDSSAGGFKTSIMYGVITIITYLLYKNNIANKTHSQIYLIYVYILFLFSVLFTNARMMIRPMVAFIPLTCISIPNLANPQYAISRKKRNLYITAFMTIAILYHLYLLFTNWQRVVPYIPYWES